MHSGTAFHFLTPAILTFAKASSPTPMPIKLVILEKEQIGFTNILIMSIKKTAMIFIEHILLRATVFTRGVQANICYWDLTCYNSRMGSKVQRLLRLPPTPWVSTKSLGAAFLADCPHLWNGRTSFTLSLIRIVSISGPDKIVYRLILKSLAVSHCWLQSESRHYELQHNLRDMRRGSGES